ncbi:hypothetical protein ACH4S8_38010 [Streptomyces sp. NPDC021080]|uniref:hypothetical protein n=1 Tax=Streptomyces sp. NPDC021080 TaxID=3365110 RepID=UPI0037B51EE3
MTDTKLIINFETTECSRCGGTGHHQYNQITGTVCFQCLGTKTVLTRRGRLARERYDEAMAARLAVPVVDLQPGDLVWAHYSTYSGYTPVDSRKAWRRVKAVEIQENGGIGRHVLDADGNKTGEIIWHPSVRLEFESTQGERAVSRSMPVEELREWTVNRHDGPAIREIMIATAKRYTGAWLNTEEPPARPAPRLRKSADVETQEPKALPANKFAGDCRHCGQRVEEQQGERLRVDGRWAVQHKTGECPEPARAEEPKEAPVPAKDGAVRVVLTRAKLYPEVSRPGPAWTWSYSYAIGGAPAVGYGPGLSSLRDMLRTKFRATGVEIVEAWNTPAPAPAVEAKPARPAMVNKFGGSCRLCSVWVEEGKGERLNVDGKWVTQHTGGTCPEKPAPRPAVEEPGLYRAPGGRLYRVREGDEGRLYSREITRTEAGNVRFVRDPGSISRLSSEDRLSVEEAERISQDWDVCMNCGRELTVSRGMGPVCRKRV